jgi:RHH-type proline utilization regulon transcriptional repressor/proline dehydrogenase/delta 1-pyrroline-5-carboxylate dehydrogenase
MQRLMGLLIREAGKSAPNAIAEVREAVDFLRYYAGQVRKHFDNATHVPLGPVVCISPWNFPLAIFVGQVSAALAAGNTVLAKPAEQTPLVAAEAVRALWAAGVPRAALQLLPGRGEVVGAKLVADARVRGVLFTGSTDVARILQRTLAGRVDARGKPVPLVAETGGQNAMIVDSSALAEQAVADVLNSAFDSAGQRCSALRVLCVQEDAADRVLEMLLGAMAELRVGNPDQLAVDVGPVIDAEARDNILSAPGARCAPGAGACTRSPPWPRGPGAGHLRAADPDRTGKHRELEREVFGPVLHFVRYQREELDGLLGAINGTGYGLTLGLHTRIDETIARVLAAAHAGNVYVNRNMVGAVVGVQPFGGEGLSGTGPKAGGPLYMLRLLDADADADAEANGDANAGAEADRLVQLAAVLSVGSTAIWPADAAAQALHASLPAEVRQCMALANDWTADTVAFDAALYHGGAHGLAGVMRRLAARPGPIVGVRAFAPGDTGIPLESLVVERALSVNTAAAGGNASLMTIG